jgi:CheY-like chemotaxis protein
MGPPVPERRIILIVEDDSELRRLIVLLFEESGERPHVLRNEERIGAEARFAKRRIDARWIAAYFAGSPRNVVRQPPQQK